MTETNFTVKQFANMIGITERTLQYYDRKGILKPTSYTDHGHRLYTYEDIFTAQKIITFKYLGFSLKEIKAHLYENAAKNMQETLKEQKKLLEEKRDHLIHVIRTISRVEKMADMSEINKDLLLAIIHATQAEENVEQWLANHLSPSAMEKIFMRHLSEEERLEIERKTMVYVHHLQQLYHQGLSPEHADVQMEVAQLLEYIGNLWGEDIFEQINALEIEGDALYHFTFLPKEVESFISQAIDVYMEQMEFEEEC
ncbi:MerR family transcriptional regulator [Virgibacillus sp. Bac330]|uniref:MerR family transcriptional regulator n=1 Tax=Virgibacillus sp. Bac330 TaxID=2419841 RepID=UPI000EF520D3|nr:MerR family transcriptional regulator [Virgibacillus sp. Bac330]